MAGSTTRRVAWDRDECRKIIQTKGLEEALKVFPVEVVRPIARHLHKWPSQVKKSVWKDEWTKRLGTVPDSALASEFGVSYQTVRKHRTALGIPAKTRQGWQLEEMAQISLKDLTVLTEDELQQKYNMPLTYIRAERHRRGLANKSTQGDTTRSVIASMLVVLGNQRGVYSEIARRLGMSRERVRQLAIEVRSVLTEKAS